MKRAKELMGEEMDIPLGVSIGAMYVSGIGSEYTEVFKSADKALYRVKQNGKHGYAIFTYDTFDDKEDNQLMNMKSISMILAEKK